jgi:2-hydroxy-6-oxonona-2,4-dienedioate hydrolase
MSILEDLDQAATRVETNHAHGKTVARIWSADKPNTIVLSHGSFGAWSHWVRNIPALAEHRKVIALDLPGMGESDQPPEPISAESMGAIIAECLTQVLAPDERFELAGFSFGGIVGGQAALLLEDRIDRFYVLGSNALGLQLDVRPPMKKPNRSMSEDEIRDVHKHNLGVIMFGDHDQIDDIALDLQSRNTRRARSRSGAIPKGDSLAKALATLDIPIRAIWGEKDATAGQFLGERQALFEKLPNCEAFTIIPGAGHWVAFEAHEAVNSILLEDRA